MTPTQPPKVFIDPETLLAVTIPPGWVVDNSARQGTRAFFFHPELIAGFRPNINLIVQPMSVLTRGECLTLSRLQVKHLAGVLLFDVDQSGERPEGSHVLEWTVTQANPPLKVRQSLFFDGGKMFVLTATAPVSVFESLRPEIESSLQSAHVGKPAGNGSGLYR